jgi:hypothetical protein
MAGYFSFNEIKDISSSTAVCCFRKCFVFKNTRDNQIKPLLLLMDFLGISSIYYSNTLQKTLVGYETA